MPDLPYSWSRAGGEDAGRLPLSLKIVAWLFIISGILATIDLFLDLWKGTLSINLGVLNLFIGLGLLQLLPVWRTCALIFTWFELIGFPLFALLVLTGSGVVTMRLFGERQVNDFVARLVLLIIAGAFFSLSIWQYLILTRPDVLRLFFPAFEREPASWTPWKVALFALMVLVCVAGANNALTTTRGSGNVAFGTATARTPEYAAYFDRVGRELDGYLQAQGLSPTSTKPSHGYDVHDHYVAQKNTWYVKEEGSKRGLSVLVVQPTENMSGIDVEVQWLARDYSWEVNSLESQARDLQTEITARWQQYKKDNPIPHFPIGE